MLRDIYNIKLPKWRGGGWERKPSSVVRISCQNTADFINHSGFFFSQATLDVFIALKFGYLSVSLYVSHP